MKWQNLHKNSTTKGHWQWDVTDNKMMTRYKHTENISGTTRQWIVSILVTKYVNRFIKEISEYNVGLQPTTKWMETIHNRAEFTSIIDSFKEIKRNCFRVVSKSCCARNREEVKQWRRSWKRWKDFPESPNYQAVHSWPFMIIHQLVTVSCLYVLTDYLHLS